MAAVISFVGRSGSGKTTLIEKLIPDLTSRGLRVGTIKHDAHEFEIDKPGKDSYRHKQAGAVTSIITSETKLAMVKSLREPVKLEKLIHDHFSDVDLVIVEGFKNENVPKIEVIRQIEGRELIFSPEELIAIATDIPEIITAGKGIDINDIVSLADLIRSKMKELEQ